MSFRGPPMGTSLSTSMISGCFLFIVYFFMANIFHATQPIDFHTAPVSYSPSPLTFGFGLSSPSVWPVQHQIQNILSRSHYISQQKIPAKRKHENTEDDFKDFTMEPSPIPESITARQIIPKKTRKNEEVDEEGNDFSLVDEVDIGILLGECFCERL